MVRGNELTIDQRSNIITLHQQGLSYGKIAKSVSVAKVTVFKTVRNFKERGSLETAPRSGRPRKDTARQRRWLARQTLKQPTLSWGQLSAALNGIPTSRLRRAAYEAGLTRRKELKRPFLNALTRRKSSSQ